MWSWSSVLVSVSGIEKEVGMALVLFMGALKACIKYISFYLIFVPSLLDFNPCYSLHFLVLNWLILNSIPHILIKCLLCEGNIVLGMAEVFVSRVPTPPFLILDSNSWEQVIKIPFKAENHEFYKRITRKVFVQRKTPLPPEQVLPLMRKHLRWSSKDSIFYL